MGFLGFPNFGGNNNGGGQSTTSQPGRENQPTPAIDIGNVLGSVIAGFLNPSSQNQDNVLSGAIAGFEQALNPTHNSGEIQTIPNVAHTSWGSAPPLISGAVTPATNNNGLGGSNIASNFMTSAVAMVANRDYTTNFPNEEDQVELGSFYIGGLPFSLLLVNGNLVLVLETEGLCLVITSFDTLNAIYSLYSK